MPRSLSLQQNTDMRKITSWAATIAVPTMVAGVYGMNFGNVAGPHRRFGFLAVITFMLLVPVAAALARFERRGLRHPLRQGRRPAAPGCWPRRRVFRHPLLYGADLLR
jgi:CorA-like Mg2+ transporter protein